MIGRRRSWPETLAATEDEAESALEELVRIGKLKLGIMDDGNAYYWAEVGWAEDPDAGARKPSVFDKEAALQKTSPIARCVYHFTQEMKLFYCGGTVSHGDIVPKLGCTHVEAQIALDELEPGWDTRHGRLHLWCTDIP